MAFVPRWREVGFPRKNGIMIVPCRRWEACFCHTVVAHNMSKPGGEEFEMVLYGDTTHLLVYLPRLDLLVLFASPRRRDGLRGGFGTKIHGICGEEG